MRCGSTLIALASATGLVMPQPQVNTSISAIVLVTDSTPPRW
jgi:hypothetical protein